MGEERQVIRDTIAEWNVMHSRERSVVLMPLGWETHTSPELGDRPQQIINDRVLVHADILVGVFWTRIGSPTGKAISGSVEEIEEHRGKGKPVMLYFSDAPIPPQEIDHDQYHQLSDFRRWAQQEGLIENYRDVQDFRDKFRRHLVIALQSDPLLKPLLQETNQSSPTVMLRLSGDAMELLEAAATHKSGLVTISRNLSSTTISAAGRGFGQPFDRRSVAHWEAVVSDLVEFGYLVDRNGKNEIFHVTDAGYRAAGL